MPSASTTNRRERTAAAEWVSARMAAIIIGCNNKQIPILVSEGVLTRKQVSRYFHVKFLRADCERLARESVIPANSPRNAPDPRAGKPRHV